MGTGEELKRGMRDTANQSAGGHLRYRKAEATSPTWSVQKSRASQAPEQSSDVRSLTRQRVWHHGSSETGCPNRCNLVQGPGCTSSESFSAESAHQINDETDEENEAECTSTNGRSAEVEAAAAEQE